MLCNNSDDNVINSVENAREDSFHKVTVGESEVEEDKIVRDITENISEDSVERTTVVQKVVHVQAKVDVPKTNQSYA